MTKKVIKLEWDIDLLSDTTKHLLKDFASKIDEYINQYGGDAEIRFYSCYDEPEAEIITRREETDEEYSKRLTLEEQSKNRQDFHDRREWERLKAKYGE